MQPIYAYTSRKGVSAARYRVATINCGKLNKLVHESGWMLTPKEEGWWKHVWIGGVD